MLIIVLFRVKKFLIRVFRIFHSCVFLYYSCFCCFYPLHFNTNFMPISLYFFLSFSYICFFQNSIPFTTSASTIILYSILFLCHPYIILNIKTKSGYFYPLLFQIKIDFSSYFIPYIKLSYNVSIGWNTPSTTKPTTKAITMIIAGSIRVIICSVAI